VDAAIDNPGIRGDEVLDRVEPIIENDQLTVLVRLSCEAAKGLGYECAPIRGGHDARDQRPGRSKARRAGGGMRKVEAQVFSEAGSFDGRPSGGIEVPPHSNDHVFPERLTYTKWPAPG